MQSKNVLSRSQINYINQQVGQVFGEETGKALTLDIQNFIQQANQVIKQMELEEIFSTKDNRHKGWKLASLTPRRQSLSLKGYLLIFKFREYLLNESINYRYYYEDGKGNSHVVTFTDTDIGKYVKFSPKGIQLNETKLKQAEIQAEFEQYLNRYFKLLTTPNPNQYFQKKNAHGLYRVTKNVAQSYSIQNKYPAFNKGHIYEAIDNTFSQILYVDDESLDNEQVVINYIFNKYLVRDSVKGSRGADNNITSTSIKSGGADLYNFYTIKTQLQQIVELLNSDPVQDSQKIAEIIIQNFLHDSKFNNEEHMQITASAAVDKIIAELNKYNKK